MTANIIIGMKLSIGPFCPTPMIPAPQPHWNTATRRPYAAPIERTFMMTALSGTTSDRNTTRSSRNDNPSTTNMNIGRCDPRKLERSTNAAVAPADVHEQPGTCDRCGDHARSELVDERNGVLIFGSCGGEHLHHGRVTGGAEIRGRDVDDAGYPRDRRRAAPGAHRRPAGRELRSPPGADR